MLRPGEQPGWLLRQYRLVLHWLRRDVTDGEAVVGGTGTGTGQDEELGLLGLLAEDTRRAVYFAVRQASEPLSRKKVAAEVGIDTRLATFHLEKLLDAGLLSAHYKRPPGRSGPGAGRTAKYYQPADVEVAVTIPARDYRRLGEALVRAVADTGEDEETREAVRRIAREQGRSDGTALRRQQRLRRPGRARTLDVVTRLLHRQGYEPYRSGDTVALGNCPFHRLAQLAPELVCTVNQAYIRGALEGLGGVMLPTVLACRRPGDCCVQVGDIGQ